MHINTSIHVNDCVCVCVCVCVCGGGGFRTIAGFPLSFKNHDKTETGYKFQRTKDKTAQFFLKIILYKTPFDQEAGSIHDNGFGPLSSTFFRPLHTSKTTNNGMTQIEWLILQAKSQPHPPPSLLGVGQ